ncbi:MAG: hypothetical protein L6R42_001963 [Xanthoria sp. 1 TBL-2021]|nr:MAG: hypothetical protein L6R42_001963 [Xanthoria sp. 1 TBL-2021]
MTQISQQHSSHKQHFTSIAEPQPLSNEGHQTPQSNPISTSRQPQHAKEDQQRPLKFRRYRPQVRLKSRLYERFNQPKSRDNAIIHVTRIPRFIVLQYIRRANFAVDPDPRLRRPGGEKEDSRAERGEKRLCRCRKRRAMVLMLLRRGTVVM